MPRSELSLIAGAVGGRFMPPWKAEPGYGDFAGERRLTDAQIALDSRLGQSRRARRRSQHLKPQPPKFADGWQGGQPDQVLTIPVKYSLPADGPDQYRCFVLPTGLDHDVYLDGTEFRPGNRRIVHHALVFLDASGKAREMAAASPDGSYPCFGGPGFPAAGLIGGWAPGLTPPPHDPELSQPTSQGHGRGDSDPLPSFGKAGAGSIVARAELFRSAHERPHVDSVVRSSPGHSRPEIRTTLRRHR